MKGFLLVNLCLLAIHGIAAAENWAGWLLGCLKPGSGSFANIQPTTTAEHPVQLVLYTSNGSYFVPAEDAASLVELSEFDKQKITIFYYPGYKENNQSGNVIQVKQALQATGNFNFILVDASYYFCKDPFSASFHCVFHVAPKMKDAIQRMHENGLAWEKIHLMGFSLGAIASGFTGKFTLTTGKKIPMITGLDPGGLVFGWFCIFNLKKGDADFVQTIHTDRGIYGGLRVCSDMAVLVNHNGFRFQSGCPCKLIPFAQNESPTLGYTEEEGNTTTSVTEECGCVRQLLNGEDMEINLIVWWFTTALTISTAESLMDCFDLGNESFLMAPSSVTKGLGPMAFRFYNGNNANISEEIPLDNGIQITRLPGFDSSKKILIYIPGYKENVFYESIHLIVNAYLKRGDTNVIVLDWSGYSTRDYVTAMVTCVTEVPRVADVIKQMVDKGIPLENFHIMGHSLGAQCAGHIGKRFKNPKLKIITGLDPAGPIIGFFCNLGLQRGDAEFVHIIHTDRGLYGTARTCGDFDVFFNNNGYRFQTGCPCVLVPIIFTFREACSHHRSWRFYAESVAGEAEYFCSVSDSHTDFLKGRYTNETLTAAYGADHSSRGNCYIETNGKAPFGKGLMGARHAR